MSELVFYTGTMDSGKSTLALQTHHNHVVRGRSGLVFTHLDRSGPAHISTRLGLSIDAMEVSDDLNFITVTQAHLLAGNAVEFLICDEAQFYTPEQIEQLAIVVDELRIDVFAFGITTDFRTHLFPGSQRLMEVADRVEHLQVTTLCWCGRTATHNARIVDGVMVTRGETVSVGDMVMHGTADATGTGGAADEPNPASPGPVTTYTVLCRFHHRAKDIGPAVR
ncbi:MAG: thymidine kinase [Cellulomonadaceae bacterium]|jgi:thymidine kinase|nr:thymidine kinase [Cellulomonadaceae bacterium]